jgi:hypothetical protein
MHDDGLGIQGEGAIRLSSAEAYYARLSARPAYAAHVMVSYESLRAKEG